jgi:hypothetical protein
VVRDCFVSYIPRKDFLDQYANTETGGIICALLNITDTNGRMLESN